MSEIETKYLIGVRRFKINWVGIYSLYCKETLRFLTVFFDWLDVIYKLYDKRGIYGEDGLLLLLLLLGRNGQRTDGIY